jgi:predicted dehydrogenase
MSEPVRWGVLGVAKIATEKVIPAMQRGALCRIDAIASRDAARAKAAADQLGVGKAYGSYEELLADPAIEAVYNPLPNELHVPWTEKALAAGKHVLCEKPIALDAAQAQRLIEARAKSGKLVAEAFMVRYHPQWRRVREIVRSGAIGEVGAIQTLFTYRLLDPGNVRNRPPGGGGLYDIGCYAIVAGRFFFGADPQRAVALVDRDPVLRVDRTTSGLVDFGGGRHLDFTVATQLVPYQRVQLCGTRGRIEIQIPFNAPANGATRIMVDDGSALDGSGIAVETLPPCDQYGLEADAFSRAVRGKLPLPYGIDDALVNMRVIDALFRSERSARWEAI